MFFSAWQTAGDLSTKIGGGGRSSLLEGNKTTQTIFVPPPFFMVVFWVRREAFFWCFYGVFLVVLRRFRTGFMHIFALICKHRQTSRHWPLRFYTARVLFLLLSLSLPPSLFLAFGGRSVAILSFPWGRSERRFTLSFSLNCFQLK